MSILMIFNHQPYDGSDVTWNGLNEHFPFQTKTSPLTKGFL
jgi:hypothetical protein